jgi:hypothetical protein
MATASSRGLKINTDGASREADKNGGWGYVMRDDGGRVIQSVSGRLRYAFSPLHMDLACVGVKAAMGLGIRDIVLDLAVQVVEALLGDDFQIIDSWWCSG